MWRATSELFDSNILIDALNNVDLARVTIDGCRYPSISVLTWIEVMVGVSTHDEDDARTLLGKFKLLEVSPPVLRQSVKVRRETRLKLTDAIILATAQVTGRVLVTRNTRDFPVGSAGVWTPYQI